MEAALVKAVVAVGEPWEVVHVKADSKTGLGFALEYFVEAALVKAVVVVGDARKLVHVKANVKASSEFALE